jgi:tetratricopeptide (TPR) repeat protein
MTWTRRAGGRISSAVFGSVALVVAAVLALLKSLPVERWVLVGGLALGAIVVIAREILIHRESEEAKEREREAPLRFPPVPVSETDPFALGVTPSEIADKYAVHDERPPYVKRDIDSELDRLLLKHHFVAVVGPSKAGKSRSAFEAVSRVYPDRLLIAPELPSFERGGMADAVEQYVKMSSTGVVIWLDDLQEFLRTKTVATQDINRWRGQFPDVTVIATIRDGELMALRSGDGPNVVLERVMDQAKMIALPPLLSKEERKRAESAYPEEEFSDGIGVHLVAGQQLVERYMAAKGANPMGFAVVSAAIDRQRAGLYDPATPKELFALAPDYLREVLPRTDLSKREAEAALEWGSQAVLQDIALLLKAGPANDAFEPFEYVVAYRDGEVSEGMGACAVPRGTWEKLISENDNTRVRAIGWSAMSRKEHEIAKDAFEKVTRSQDAHLAAHGLVDLGDALWELGQRSDAKDCYVKAAKLDYGCVVASACFSMALSIETSEGDGGGEDWYRRVLAFPESPEYPKALVNLGLVLRGKTNVKSRREGVGRGFMSDSDRSNLTAGDHALEREAQTFFEAATDSTDREAVANGGNALGVLLAAQGKRADAEIALRKAADAGSVHAKIRLIALLGEEESRRGEANDLIGELEEAELDERATAYFDLSWARLREWEGRTAEAIDRLRKVVLRGGLAQQEAAKLNLARLLDENGGDTAEVRSLVKEVAVKGSVLSEEAEKLLRQLDERDGKS